MPALLAAGLGLFLLCHTTQAAPLTVRAFLSRPPAETGLWFQYDPILDPPISEESEFLDRGRRNPWMAGLASLVLPGAGQFYNAAAPHRFTLKGYDWWMYGQGGGHAFVLALSVFNQFTGIEIQYVWQDDPHVLGERNAQRWRVIHLINALVASVSAFLEARLINAAGWDYFKRMRMHAFYDPVDDAMGVEVCLAF